MRGPDRPAPARFDVVFGQRSASHRSYRRAGGFSRFEFAVTATIVALLALVFLQRILYYQEEAERAQVRHLIGDLRTVLRMKTAELEVHSRGAEQALLAGQNPMEWLPEKPPNYLGEFYAPAADDVDRGNWYFDLKKRELVYVLRHGKFFVTAESNRWCFKVEFFRLPKILARPSETTKEVVVLNQVNG
jgi:hypothetical protein